MYTKDFSCIQLHSPCRARKPASELLRLVVRHRPYPSHSNCTLHALLQFFFLLRGSQCIFVRATITRRRLPRPVSARLSQSRHPRVPTQHRPRPMRHAALRRPSHPNADGRQLLSKSAPDRSTPLALPRRAACGPRDCASGLIHPGRGSLVGFRRSVRLPRDAFIREYVSNVPQKQPFSIPPGLFFSDNSSSVRELIKPAGCHAGV